jgi:signal transduction histidine kinase
LSCATNQTVISHLEKITQLTPVKDKLYRKGLLLYHANTLSLEYYLSMLKIKHALQMIPKRTSIIAILLGFSAIAFSIYFVRYYDSITDNIMQIETEDISSNTEIESNMISKILVKSVESVVDNLRLISNAPSVQNGDSSGTDLLALAENNTNNLADFYIWLDSEGHIIGTSSSIGGTKEHLVEDLSNATFFSMPEKTFDGYVSNISFFDNIPRMFISFPIMGKNIGGEINFSLATADSHDGASNTHISESGAFKGIIAAAIRVDTLGEYLQDQIPPEYKGFVGVVNGRGIILSSTNLSHIGKSIFDTDLNPIIPSQAKDQFNIYLNKVLFEKKPSVQNITYDSRHISIGYQPMFFDRPVGDQFATLFVVSSQQATDEISSLMQQQASFGISVYGIIIVLSTGLAFIVLLWNKKLKDMVNKNTKELQKANQNLHLANEQLKVHDKMQKDFINIAAHELRTPIQVIMGNAELATSDPAYKEFDDKNGQFINAISRNASRLHRLTEYILDVAKIESNLLKIKKEELNINEKVKDVVDYFKNKQEAHCNDGHTHKKRKNVEFVFIRPKVNPIIVEADASRFEQVISNLMDNAIKFIDSTEGKVTVSIDFDADYANQHNNVKDKKKSVIISVKDNGRGIHPDMFHNLFDKFTSKAEFGTGLGLFISKSIIESHGGKIWAENNKDGRGATLSFSLPLKD